MKKVAILYICTGKYSVLWKEFYKSFQEKFLLECNKEYFVFTDARSLEHENSNPKVHIIEQEPLDWPYSTLMRFHMFNRIKDVLSPFDYIFFFNANACAVNIITEDAILPRIKYNEELCVVKHPAYRNCKPFEFPYDRNFSCKAFIPYGFGKVYVQGCLIGGTATGFLKMSETISDQIDKDLSRNIIALWHDESYLNKYTLNNKHYRLLGIEFANPISDNPDTVMIHMRQKKRYFDVDVVKSNTTEMQLKGINRFYKEKIFRLLSKRDLFRSDIKEQKKKYGLTYSFAWGIKNCWRILF